MPRWLAWSAGITAAVTLVFLAQGLSWAPRPLARALPRTWEASIGSRIAEQAAHNLGGTCSSEAGQVAIDALAQRLERASDLPFAATVRVVHNPAVNAFAFPGAQILILDGLLKDAQSADEVAAVLAHELSHVALRHVTEQAIRQLGIGWAAMAITGDPTGLAAGAIAGMLRLSYSREAEGEADRMAVELLEKADISTQGMGNFFRRQEQQEKLRRASSTLLSDHPPSTDRIPPPTLQPFARPALSGKEWQALRNICDTSKTGHVLEE